jgi:hypothetical protein
VKPLAANQSHQRRPSIEETTVSNIMITAITGRSGKALVGLLAVAACTLASSPAVHAQDQFAPGGLRDDCFTQSAVAMTPYDVTIQQEQYRMTHERVYHNAGAIGSILLYGPVHPWRGFGEGFSFAVTYKDPDGVGTAAQVTAQLRHVGPQGIRIIATLDSNRSARTSEDAQVMSTPVAWSQVGDRTGYFVVRVYVVRTNTAVTPAAFGYSLCSAVF